MYNFDRKMIKRIYKLTDSEVFDVEKLSNRLGISPCAAAKIVKNKAVL